MIEIVPATRELMEAHKGIPPKTVRALVGVDDGQVLGMAGYYHTEEGLVLWSSIPDGNWKHKREIVRGYRRLLAMALKVGIPIFAQCDRNKAAADRLLRHIGFKPFRDDIYIFEGGRRG